jgi:hypothetical protein
MLVAVVGRVLRARLKIDMPSLAAVSTANVESVALTVAFKLNIAPPSAVAWTGTLSDPAIARVWGMRAVAPS